MLIILHSPHPFTYEGNVDGTLTGHETVSLSCDGGVVTLERDDVLRAIPALQRFVRLDTDPMALDAIQLELTSREWTPETLEHVADIVRATGRDVEDVG